MKLKSAIIFSLPILVLSIILHDLFIIDYRFAKEEFLIKRNYKKNIHQFADLKKDFAEFPELRIEFENEDCIDILLTSLDRINNDPLNQSSLDSIFTYPQISWLEITDSSAILHDKLILNSSNFWFEDSCLHVNAIDSVWVFNSNWQITYTGQLKTELLNQVFNATNLDREKIGKIKDKLIKLNCFGYEKTYNEDLIIYYRDNRIDFYSYLVPKDTMSIDYSSFGKIGSNVYWYHNQRYNVSYSPYLKLYNRKLK